MSIRENISMKKISEMLKEAQQTTELFMARYMIYMFLLDLLKG